MVSDHLIMAQIQFSLIKKEIGRLEHSLLPPPSPPVSPRPITSHFCLTPYPLQSGRHMYVAPYIQIVRNQEAVHMAIHTNDFELCLASIIRFIPLYFSCNMYNCNA